MKKLLGLLLLLGLVGAGWFYWNRLLGREEPVADGAPAASPQLAEAAGLKLDRLKDGQVESAAFHASELQSLLMFRFVQLLPAFVAEPKVKLEDGKIEVTARVPVDRLPSLSELGDAAGFLPDTAEIGLTGSLLPLDSGRVALSIEQVKAARIPMPQRLVPSALQKLGRKPEPGLPRNALALPLPSGVGSAQVQNDSLILRRKHP